MRKKTFWITGMVVVGLVVAVGIARYIEVRTRQTDPNWQIANEIYKVENALKEVDEGYECQSVSKVTPLTYTDPEGNTIVYYCCQTAYISNESGEHTGLDMNAIGLVIDVSQIENKRKCTVNEYDAFQCEVGGRTYLCWTLSPEISCVIEYSAESTNEADIIQMAESIEESSERHDVRIE